MAPTVRTKQGLTEGFSEGAIFKFLGVPYAEPPIGERRWRPPVPVAEWFRTLAQYDVQMLIVFSSPLFSPQSAQIVSLALEHRLNGPSGQTRCISQAASRRLPK
jgi:Carboxylesterase family